MSENRFVVQEGHFHIADRHSYVLTGWFDGESMETGMPASGKDPSEQGWFSVYLDCERLPVQVLCFADESVRQKYAKYDLNVTAEYVIIAKLPKDLSRYRRLFLCLGDGSRVYERRVAQLCRLQGQLGYRITSIQSTGASCVVSGWAASAKPIKINVFDQAKEPMKCEVSHFPKPDVALEYREAEKLYDSGFSVSVPVNGRKKMVLQITDGEHSVTKEFSAVDRNKLMLYFKKANYYMKRNGVKKACKRAVNELYELVGDTGNYMKWRRKNMPSEKELARQRRAQHTKKDCPLICVVTPYQDAASFAAAAASMKNQTYANWKWVLVCSALEQEKATERLDAYVPKSRTEIVLADGMQDEQQRIARGISEILRIHGQTKQVQQALWITLLAPCDTLEPDALYSCAELMEQNPDMDLCYTDEDQISEDGRSYREPVFKPDLNIDLLRAVNYLGHMVLLRADVAAKAGAWNPAYQADAPYDYYLRAVEAAGCVGHLPRVVYHAREAVKQARYMGDLILNAHYKRMGIPAVAKMSETPGIYHTVYQWKDSPLVSINIPNKDHIDDLDTCLQSVFTKCTYPNYEIVIIENNSTEESTFAYYKKLQEQDARVRVVVWEDTFNYSKITNFGVAHSKGEYILLLNNDTEVMTPDFIEEMLGYCMRDDVGICGARLFYFDDTIQHAGVIVGLGGICGEGFQGFPKENGGYQNRIFCPQDYSAVTAACLMTKKSVFEEVGGMDADFQIAYNDIDYCLKVRRTGRLVVYNPFAMLHHYEYKSRGVENTAEKLARYNREVDLFTTRYADMISAGDPYYNPNLTRRYQDFSLRRIELLK
ncbi:MAG: glycosyltransferase family 2 protein [Eubacterium sp.]|nr:glycosyltransferase family 2 protein [Eubacterium sp.]